MSKHSLQSWLNHLTKADRCGASTSSGNLDMDTSAQLFKTQSPSDGTAIAEIAQATMPQVNQVIAYSQAAFLKWRLCPAPERAKSIAILRDLLIRDKDRLGSLIAMEMGKSKQEGDGEVQEMIDMADFAIGQSRMLYGKTMPSERPGHRLMEQWQPLGVVLCITAFNFPMAVWAWNAMLALVCGNVIVWKPSSETPLCAIALMQLVQEAFSNTPYDHVASMILTSDQGTLDALVDNKIFSLVSFTGSTSVGRYVNERVAKRMGRCLLECGGNNAMIITPSANKKLALPAVVFSAIGTAGQRCTSLRRLMIHQSCYKEFTEQLLNAYEQITIGDPQDTSNLMGPLINRHAIDAYLTTIKQAQSLGAQILHGGKVLNKSGYFVTPTIIEVKHDCSLLQTETFAPILYLIAYDNLEDAVLWNNNVPQGLSSAIFSQDVTEIEYFLSASGSDCGIANVNIGTSGAEIGGAFGGEKETGGGREAGSDAWKIYMRRQTITINGSDQMPLSQGIEFNVS